ncbi:MAG TPA: PP2C family protein-serine/threonine phosphatase [Micromonosporaceae bacterium]|nr:PP2C family protein-serine/threonine phosphatase [Micromonosporaceae bacterium]
MTILPEAWRQAVAAVVRRSHLVPPSAVGTLVNDVAGELGVELTVYLVDHEQRQLRALAVANEPERPPLAVDTSLAGRAFRTIQVQRAGARPVRLLVPVVDGTERLGVLEVVLPDQLGDATDEAIDGATLMAGMIGHLVVAKRAYGDAIEQRRRSRPMTVAAELLWQLLPPLTFATPEMVIAAALEPCYEVGGDAFDYAVDGSTVRLGIFDAVGHGLRAALTVAVALAATRAARRDGQDLDAIARAADNALLDQFTDARFVTAVLAELDLRSGRLRYVNAGHPPAVLLRRGKAVRTLAAGRRPPLGLAQPQITVAEEDFEPGDRLMCYTDGVTEARDDAGVMFGLSRLIDATEGASAAGLPAAETLRRLTHNVVDHQNGRLDDDASLLLLEWSTAAARRSMP